MSWKTERRQHLRLQRDDNLLIQVLAASESPGLVGKTLHCAIVDVAEAGIKVGVPVEVPVYSEIDLWIDVVASARSYFLKGRVKWSYKSDTEQGIYQVGIQLLDLPFTDFDAWGNIFTDTDAVRHSDGIQ